MDQPEPEPGDVAPQAGSTPEPDDGAPQPDDVTPEAGDGAPERTGRRRRTATWLGGGLVAVLAAGLIGGWVGARSTDDDSSSSGGVTTSPVPSGAGDSLATIVAEVQPSVVSIRTSGGEGSGVIMDTNGDILTNNHVTASGTGNTVTVTFSDGSSADATIVGQDARSDIAVVRVADHSGLTPATFGKSSDLKTGDTVLALGSPLGLQGTVTSGIISAKNRTIQETNEQTGAVTSISGLLQTDAAINPGNSGGALADTAGQVIGINTAIATSGGTTGNIGVGFAIPSDTAVSVAQDIVAGRTVAHPFLGVSVTDTNGSGALVQAVTPGGPAATAGLQAGDVITKIGDQTIHSADDVVAAVSAAAPGDQVQVTYTRGGSEHTATVTLGEAP